MHRHHCLAPVGMLQHMMTAMNTNDRKSVSFEALDQFFPG